MHRRTPAWASDQLEDTQTHHSFLDEELRPLQGAGHVLTQPLALVLLQHLVVEGAHLQRKHTCSFKMKVWERKKKFFFFQFEKYTTS